MLRYGNQRISGGNAVVTLAKWHVRQGDEVKDGAHMCEVRLRCGILRAFQCGRVTTDAGV